VGRHRRSMPLASASIQADLIISRCLQDHQDYADDRGLTKGRRVSGSAERPAGGQTRASTLTIRAREPIALSRRVE